MYLAHISENKKRKQSIQEHLTGTAELAGEFAEAFGCRNWGYGCGYIHDIGKYSEKFQKRLHGGAITDHATAGAKELYQRKNYIGAYCVAGHHSGLLDGGSSADGGGEATLLGRMKKDLEDYQVYEKDIKIPEFTNPPLKQLGKGGFSLSFFIRMLFSCLVDADYIDTENFMSDGLVKRGVYDEIEVLHNRLMNHINPWLLNDDASTVNGRRTAILKACLKQGENKPGIYQLTVPTGGGKTVSSLAFALQHAKIHQKKHIIYVIPYTSIIEQNAKVFKDILGSQNVLEDHCNVVYDSQDELNPVQLASENWDIPVIVTTNVQFFESLYSNKSSRCRKLHNISNSIIIFDEAQMLPAKYLLPCIQAISELVYNYGSTAVICTATQPDLSRFFPKQLEVREICPNVQEQYEFFRRTVLEQKGQITEEELIALLRKERQVLCILNSRKRVQRVFEALKAEEGVYHLSTFMYPIHRKRILGEIRSQLAAGKPCRLISTSLVEAGVDFDFPGVYRELAGIDSVIQAAGRCNREGKQKKEDCITTVFTMEQSEDICLPQELKLPISIAGQISEQHKDIASLQAIEDYFKRLYYLKGEGLDAKDIISQLEQGARSCLFPFATIASQFHLIENDTKTILIDKESEGAAIVERIQRGEHSRHLVREAGQYCVNIYQKDFENLNGAGRLKPIGLDFYVLRNQEQYDEEQGLLIQAERGDALFL